MKAELKLVASIVGLLWILALMPHADGIGETLGWKLSGLLMAITK